MESKLPEAQDRIADLLDDLSSREIEHSAEMSLLRRKVNELQTSYLRATREAEELQKHHSQLLETHRGAKNELGSLQKQHSRLQSLHSRQSEAFYKVIAKDNALQEQKEIHSRQTKLVESLRDQLAALGEVKDGSGVKSAEAKSFSALLQSLFACPSRRGADLSGRGVSLQDMIWQVVRSIREVSFLLCSCDDLVVTNASKQAFSFFGSGSRRGSNVISLAHDEASKQLLSNALDYCTIQCGQHDDFWIQEIPGVSFATKHGVVDCTVVFARLPAEAQFMKQAAILLAVTPPGVDVEERHQYEMDLSKLPLSNLGSVYDGFDVRQHSSDGSIAASVVSQSDVHPNDSVSNVNFSCNG